MRKVKVSEDALEELLRTVLNGGPGVRELPVVHNLNKKLGGSPNALSTICDEWDDPKNHVEEDNDGNRDLSVIADRFLSWRLPEDFYPDGGIEFTKPEDPTHWPFGTNLLSSTQVTAMLEHILTNHNPAKVKVTAIHGGGDWNDASADYLILPEGLDYEEERLKWREWYLEEYLSKEGMPGRVKFLSTKDWLIRAGAREVKPEELEIVDNF